MPEIENIWKEFDTFDREELLERFSHDLSLISGEMGTTPAGLAWRTGLDTGRMQLIADGKRKMKWSEYMSVLFVLWDDERGREIIEEMGYFPDVLRRAMTAGRNVAEDTGGKESI